MGCKLQSLVAVAKFTVILRNELDEEVIEGRFLIIEAKRVGVTTQVTKATWSSGSVMPSSVSSHVIIFDSFLQVAGWVPNCHIGTGYSEGWASELPIQLKGILPVALTVLGGTRM